MAKKTVKQQEREIEQLEKQILKDKQKLAKMRRIMEPLEVEDFTFQTGGGKKVKLSQMFGKRDELVLVHNMGVRCAYCTMWADGFNGMREHLSDRAGFVVVSPDEPKVMAEFAKGRGWRFPIYSHHATTFGKALGFESPDGGAWPGVSTLFRNPNGKIYRVAKAFFGPGDDFCPPWHFFELLPRGVNGWGPKYSYKK
ncbi:MAG: DUF899 family protein [bacterium]|nr:DUF899 family protein [bacterium]